MSTLIWNAVRDYFFAHKEFKLRGKGVEWIVHTQTDWQIFPLLVHMLPLVSSILWIFPATWQCWRVATYMSRTLLQLSRYLTWLRNIQKLSQNQRSSWGCGTVEANVVISAGWDICWVHVEDTMKTCAFPLENFFPWIMMATPLKSLNKATRPLLL